MVSAKGYVALEREWESHNQRLGELTLLTSQRVRRTLVTYQLGLIAVAREDETVLVWMRLSGEYRSEHDRNKRYRWWLYGA